MPLLTSDSYADVLVGGTGADTLVAGQGPDTLTGKGGADVFVFKAMPWSAGHITDFAVGTDKLDLSVMLKGSNYMGSDPLKDGFLRFESDGAGGTRVLYDADGAAKSAYAPSLVVTLDHVAPSGLSASTVLLSNWKPGLVEAVGNFLDSGSSTFGTAIGNLVNNIAGNLVKGKVLTSSVYGANLTGGLGDDTIVAGQGPGQLTGGLGDDNFVFGQTPWNAGHITDFRPGSDDLDVSGLLKGVGYHGANPLLDGYIKLGADGMGGTQVYFDPDGAAGPQGQSLVVTLDGVTPNRIGAGDWIF